MIADRTGCQWPWRSSKVDDFHFIWTGVLVINNNHCMAPSLTVSEIWPLIATYSLKLSTENCSQTVPDRDMVTIDSL